MPSPNTNLLRIWHPSLPRMAMRIRHLPVRRLQRVNRQGTKFSFFFFSPSSLFFFFYVPLFFFFLSTEIRDRHSWPRRWNTRWNRLLFAPNTLQVDFLFFGYSCYVIIIYIWLPLSLSSSLSISIDENP
jgi:hypothetical protein